MSGDEIFKTQSVEEVFSVDGVVDYKKGLSIHTDEEEGKALHNQYFDEEPSNKEKSTSSNIKFLYHDNEKPNLEKVVIGEPIATNTYNLSFQEFSDTGVYVKNTKDGSEEKLSNLLD